MGGYTRIGAEIWDWEPFIELSALGRNLWLGLYTSGAAKRGLPGLWHGNLHVMADAARMQPDQTLTALDELIDHDVAEFDPKSRVLRLTAPEYQTPLPDTGEWPMNGKTVLGWWNRFETLPRCAVRDAHVTTLWWLIEQGAKERRSPLSNDHRHAWAQTFASVQVPAPRRRGVRRLGSYDTSTSVQPSLFPSTQAAPVLTLPASSGPTLALPLLPVDKSVPSCTGNVPHSGIVSPSVDNFRVSNDSNRNYTVSDTPRDRDRDRGGYPDFFSSFGGSGSAASERSPPVAPTPPEPSTPVLRVVPTGWTLPAVLDAITAEAGSAWPATPSETLLASLRFALSDLDAAELGVGDLRALGRFLARNPVAVSGWLAWIGRGGLVDAVGEARSWQKRHGITPTPVAVQEAPTPDVGGVG